MTLARYVSQLKLQRAAEALEKTDVPIVEIALHFGFEGQQTFTRIFSRHFHTSPGK
ncbi:helix-turn-helix domain-containing protein [Erwinia rhapontici]|uniref:helix-turn-helix domain-containing protein n=1 Tax=Erwinia rhapontici TaxID=55212 RepID=UPI001BB43428|nr:helix-turn-helix domain-containing protein [Erwinia rhapontici]